MTAADINRAVACATVVDLIEGRASCLHLLRPSREGAPLVVRRLAEQRVLEPQRLLLLQQEVHPWVAQ